MAPLHTETFSCVFVLFQVMSWLFSIPLRTVNSTKTQENVSVCMGPKFVVLVYSFNLFERSAVHVHDFLKVLL